MPEWAFHVVHILGVQFQVGQQEVAQVGGHAGIYEKGNGGPEPAPRKALLDSLEKVVGLEAPVFPGLRP